MVQRNARAAARRPSAGVGRAAGVGCSSGPVAVGAPVRAGGSSAVLMAFLRRKGSLQGRGQPRQRLVPVCCVPEKETDSAEVLPWKSLPAAPGSDRVTTRWSTPCGLRLAMLLMDDVVTAAPLASVVVLPLQV